MNDTCSICPSRLCTSEPSLVAFSAGSLILLVGTLHSSALRPICCTEKLAGCGPSYAKECVIKCVAQLREQKGSGEVVASSVADDSQSNESQSWEHV